MLMLQPILPDHDLAAPAATLPERLPAGLALEARCGEPGCGARATIDPASWLAQGLAGAALDRLETRLRCACGARRARLEIAPRQTQAPGRASIYVFR